MHSLLTRADYRFVDPGSNQVTGNISPVRAARGLPDALRGEDYAFMLEAAAERCQVFSSQLGAESLAWGPIRVPGDSNLPYISTLIGRYHGLHGLTGTSELTRMLASSWPLFGAAVASGTTLAQTGAPLALAYLDMPDGTWPAVDGTYAISAVRVSGLSEVRLSVSGRKCGCDGSEELGPDHRACVTVLPAFRSQLAAGLDGVVSDAGTVLGALKNAVPELRSPNRNGLPISPAPGSGSPPRLWGTPVRNALLSYARLNAALAPVELDEGSAGRLRMSSTAWGSGSVESQVMRMTCFHSAADEDPIGWGCLCGYDFPSDIVSSTFYMSRVDGSAIDDPCCFTDSQVTVSEFESGPGATPGMEFTLPSGFAGPAYQSAPFGVETQSYHPFVVSLCVAWAEATYYEDDGDVSDPDNLCQVHHYEFRAVPVAYVLPCTVVGSRRLGVASALSTGVGQSCLSAAGLPSSADAAAGSIVPSGWPTWHTVTVGVSHLAFYAAFRPPFMTDLLEFRV